MSSRLEPTIDARRALVRVAYGHMTSGYKPDQVVGAMIDELWDLIVPMVLETAAKESDQHGCCCADDIRALSRPRATRPAPPQR